MTQTTVQIVSGILFLILIATAVWVAQDARKRGMSPVGWFLGVFLLHVFALVLYFIIRKPVKHNG